MVQTKYSTYDEWKLRWSHSNGVITLITNFTFLIRKNKKNNKKKLCCSSTANQAARLKKEKKMVLIKPCVGVTI
jgi:hypothetical protein